MHLYKTSRDAFSDYIKRHPGLVSHPVEGMRIAAMQYTDPKDGNKLKAQAVYMGVGVGPVLVSYFIDEEQSE